MPKSSFRLTALLSGAIVCTSAPAMAQRTSALNAMGLDTLVARSSSHVVVVQPAIIQRPDPNATVGEREDVGEPLSPAVAHALGCLLVGTVGTSIAAFAGTKNVVNIIAGGHVVPASQLALYTAVVGVVFGTFCAVGQALTPLYLHVMRPRPAPPVRRQLEHKVDLSLAHRATGAARIERGSFANVTSEPEDMRVEDMRVPAIWLYRKN